MGIDALTIPRWGMEMTEGTIVSWLIDEGNEVHIGDELVEIETTKITNVLESPFSGVLRRHVESAGKTVPSGGLIGVIASADTPDSEIDAFVGTFEAESAAEEAPDELVSGPLDLEVGKVQVVHRLIADRAPVMFVHGFGADIATWMFNLTEVAAVVGAVALDLPGHGASGKSLGSDPSVTLIAAIEQAMAALDVDAAHFVGHSLGAVCCLRFAAASPGRVASLTLLAPAGLGGPVSDDYLRAFVEAKRRKDLRAALEMLVSRPEAVTLKMVNDVLRYKRLEGVDSALSELRNALLALDQQELMDTVRTADCPVQLLWGSEDRVSPPLDQHDGSPDVTLLAGAGHLIHMERSSDVNKAILRFAQS